VSRFRLWASALALLGVVGAIGACGGSPRNRSYEYVDTTDREILPPPFTAEETTALRTGFSWSTTNALPEADSLGRPTLFYAIMLVADREAADFLEIAEVHHSPLPIFGDEMARWDEYGAGAIDPTGDDHGTFVFAILTGAMYNVFREEALAGNAPFEAIILRAPPDTTLVNPDGSLDFDRLIDGGFTYGYAEEVVASAMPLHGATAQPLFGRLSRLVHKIVTFARNVVPWIAARVRPKRDFTMRMRVVNVRSPFFDSRIAERTPGFDRNILRRAWDDASPPIVPHGAKVEIRSALALTLSHVDGRGQVQAEIPNSERIRIILRLKNGAAMITGGGLYERHMTISKGHDGVDSRSADVHLALDFRDSAVHGFTVLTDSQDYARERLDLDPRGAVVTDGPREGGNASPTGCWTFYGMETVSLGSGRGWSLAGAIWGRLFTDTDMVLRGNDDASRGVPVHEYGHFLMCDSFYKLSTFDFGRAYGELLREVVGDGTGTISSDSQARHVAEGWADFYSAEVVGGVNYFRPRGAAKLTDAIAYCAPGAFGISRSDPCTDDNWGGPIGSFPAWDPPSTDPDFGTSPDKYPIGTVATVLVDAFDRSSPTPTASNAEIVWSLAAPAVSSFDSPWSDESVELDGPSLLDIAQSWSDHSNRLDRDSFLSAVADVSEREFGHSATCEMMALHDPQSDCEVIAPSLAPIATSPAPVFRLIATASYDGVSTSPVITARWFSLDAAATSVRVDVLGASGSVVASAVVPASIVGSWTSSGGIPFDANLVVRVTPLSGADDGIALERTVHTAPEVVRTISVFEGVREVTVAWPSVAATSYRLIVTDYYSGAVTVYNTTDTFVKIIGGGTIRVRVFSVGSDGVPSSVGSEEKIATALLE